MAIRPAPGTESAASGSAESPSDALAVVAAGSTMGVGVKVTVRESA